MDEILVRFGMTEPIVIKPADRETRLAHFIPSRVGAA